MIVEVERETQQRSHVREQRPVHDQGFILDPLSGETKTDLFNTAIRDTGFQPRFSPEWLRKALKVGDGVEDPRAQFTRYYYSRRLMIDFLPDASATSNKLAALKRKLCLERGYVYVDYVVGDTPTLQAIAARVRKETAAVQKKFKFRPVMLEFEGRDATGKPHKVLIPGMDTGFDGRYVGFDERGQVVDETAAKQIQETAYEDALAQLSAKRQRRPSSSKAARKRRK